jgi:hypothetical protein
MKYKYSIEKVDVDIGRRVLLTSDVSNCIEDSGIVIGMKGRQWLVDWGDGVSKGHSVCTIWAPKNLNKTERKKQN